MAPGNLAASPRAMQAPKGKHPRGNTGLKPYPRQGEVDGPVEDAPFASRGIALIGIEGHVQMELIATAGEPRAADRADAPLAAAHGVVPLDLRRGAQRITLDLGE